MAETRDNGYVFLDTLLKKKKKKKTVVINMHINRQQCMSGLDAGSRDTPCQSGRLVSAVD